MRKVIAVVVILCLAYFVIGWVAMYFGMVDREKYFAYTGLVGGVASVAGLIAFFRPALSKSDVDAVGIESLKSLTKTAEELKELEEAQARAKGELGDLEIKKKEVELLVRKASLALFLREQHSYYEQQIKERLEGDVGLMADLGKIDGIQRQLEALNEQIDSSPNVKLVREVISSAQRQDRMDEIIEAMPFFLRPFLELSRIIIGEPRRRK